MEAYSGRSPGLSPHSLYSGERLKGKRGLEDLGLEGNLIPHTQDPQRSQCAALLTNPPAPCMDFGMFPYCWSSAGMAGASCHLAGPCLGPPKGISGPHSSRRARSLSALSDISGVPRSSVPCPLHKCNFPKCQEESITDNTLCVSLTQ